MDPEQGGRHQAHGGKPVEEASDQQQTGRGTEGHGEGEQGRDAQPCEQLTSVHAQAGCRAQAHFQASRGETQGGGAADDVGRGGGWSGQGSLWGGLETGVVTGRGFRGGAPAINA